MWQSLSALEGTFLGTGTPQDGRLAAQPGSMLTALCPSLCPISGPCCGASHWGGCRLFGGWIQLISSFSSLYFNFEFNFRLLNKQRVIPGLLTGHQPQLPRQHAQTRPHGPHHRAPGGAQCAQHAARRHHRPHEDGQRGLEERGQTGMALTGGSPSKDGGWWDDTLALTVPTTMV